MQGMLHRDPIFRSMDLDHSCLSKTLTGFVSMITHPDTPFSSSVPPALPPSASAPTASTVQHSRVYKRRIGEPKYSSPFIVPVPLADMMSIRGEEGEYVDDGAGLLVRWSLEP